VWGCGGGAAEVALPSSGFYWDMYAEQ